MYFNPLTCIWLIKTRHDATRIGSQCKAIPINTVENWCYFQWVHRRSKGKHRERSFNKVTKVQEEQGKWVRNQFSIENCVGKSIDFLENFKYYLICSHGRSQDFFGGGEHFFKKCFKKFSKKFSQNIQKKFKNFSKILKKFQKIFKKISKNFQKNIQIIFKKNSKILKKFQKIFKKLFKKFLKNSWKIF